MQGLYILSKIWGSDYPDFPHAPLNPLSIQASKLHQQDGGYRRYLYYTCIVPE